MATGAGQEYPGRIRPLQPHGHSPLDVDSNGLGDGLRPVLPGAGFVQTVFAGVFFVAESFLELLNIPFATYREQFPGVVEYFYVSRVSVRELTPDKSSGVACIRLGV
jgi:hypothetical protein